MRSLAVLAALAAAVLVPGDPPGIGIVIVAALVAAAGLSRATRTVDLAILGGAALALASMAAVLDARWIVVLDLCGAWLLVTLAVDAPRLVALAAPIVSLRWIRDLAPPPTSLGIAARLARRAVPRIRRRADHGALRRSRLRA